MINDPDYLLLSKISFQIIMKFIFKVYKILKSVPLEKGAEGIGVTNKERPFSRRPQVMEKVLKESFLLYSGTE